MVNFSWSRRWPSKRDPLYFMMPPRRLIPWRGIARIPPPGRHTFQACARNSPNSPSGNDCFVRVSLNCLLNSVCSGEPKYFSAFQSSNGGAETRQWLLDLLVYSRWCSCSTTTICEPLLRLQMVVVEQLRHLLYTSRSSNHWNERQFLFQELCCTAILYNLQFMRCRRAAPWCNAHLFFLKFSTPPLHQRLQRPPFSSLTISKM